MPAHTQITYNGIRVPTREDVKLSYEQAQQAGGDKKTGAEETSKQDKE